MFLLEIAILSLLLGLARKGSVKNFFTGGVRAWILFLAAIALFVGTKAMCLAGVTSISNIAFYITIVTYVLLFIGLFFNLDGIWSYVLLLGALLNFVILVMNGGLMPVSPSALSIAGLEGTNYLDNFDGFLRIADDSTIFMWKYLGAIIPLPLPSILAEVISPGTVIMAIGSFGLIQNIMTTEFMDEEQYNNYMNELSSEDKKESPILDSNDDKEKSDYTTNINQDDINKMLDAEDEKTYEELSSDNIDDSEEILFEGLDDELFAEETETVEEPEEELLQEEKISEEDVEEEILEETDDDMDEFEENLDEDMDEELEEPEEEEEITEEAGDDMDEFEEDMDEEPEEKEEELEEPEEEKEEITEDDDLALMLDGAFGMDEEPEAEKLEEVEEDTSDGLFTEDKLDKLIEDTLSDSNSNYDDNLINELKNLGKEDDEVEELSEEEILEVEEEDTEEKNTFQFLEEDDNISNIKNAQEMLRRVGSKAPKDEPVEDFPEVDTESPFIINEGRIVENPYYKFRRSKIKKDEEIESAEIKDDGLYVMSSGGLAKMDENGRKVQFALKSAPLKDTNKRKPLMPNVTTTPGFGEEKEEKHNITSTPGFTPIITNPYENITEFGNVKREEKIEKTENASTDNFVHTTRNNIIDENGNEVPNPYEQVEMKIGDVEIKFWKKDNQ